MDLILGAVEDICRTKKNIQGGGGENEQESSKTPGTTKTKKINSQVFKGHTGSVYSCQFFHSDQYILSTSEDKTIKIWNIGSRECIHTFQDKESLAILKAHIAPDDKSFLTAGLDKRLLHWCLETNQVMWEREHDGIVLCCRFSHDGQLLASGSDVDHELKIWDSRTVKPVYRLKDLHSYGITSLRFTNPNDRIISTSMDRTIKVYDLRSCKRTLTLQGHKNVVANCAFDVDSRNLATAGWDKNVFIWDIPTGKYRSVNPIHLKGHEGCVSSCVISQDGHFMISGSYDNTLIIWDLNNNKERIKLMDHTDWVEDVDISKHQAWLVSSSKDKTLRIWDITKIHTVQSTNPSEKTAPKVMQCGQCLKPFIPSLDFDNTNLLWCSYCKLDAEAERELELETQMGSELDWETELDQQVGRESELEWGDESELIVESDSESEINVDLELEGNSESELETKSGSELDIKTESELAARSEPMLAIKKEFEVEKKYDSDTNVKYNSISEREPELDSSEIESVSESDS